jgi:HlyD family secretion protein
MIPTTSAMDRPVEKTRGLTRAQWAAVACGLVLLGGLAAALPFLRRWNRAERVVLASTLRFGQVSRGDLERDVQAQGRVVAALHPTLFSPAQGIVSLEVKAGSEVKKGQVLARVQSPELTSRLAQERATLLSLQADLGRQQIALRQSELRSAQTIETLGVRQAAASRALERSKALFEQGLLNRTDYEKTQDDLQLASLDLKNAQGASRLEQETLEFETKNRRLLVERQQSIVQELQRRVEELAIVAPFDGMVAGVSVQDRDAAAQNQALLTVVNLSAFEVEFDVPENYAADLGLGTRAEIVYEGRPYAARITAVSPEVRDSQVRGTLAFDGEPPAGLRQSQRLSTRLILERKPGVLRVPRGPFLEAGGGRSAYVVQGGLASRRPIEVGAMSVSAVEIKSGLQEGDEIVLSDTSVFDGARTVLLRQ